MLLAEIAAADPDGVASALHSLRALVDTDERPVTYRNWRPEARRHWRSVEDDDALRTAVGAVLDAASRRGTAPPGSRHQCPPPRVLPRLARLPANAGRTSPECHPAGRGVRTPPGRTASDAPVLG
ncbi:hypothetical protein [Nonomuraea dietziae]|uniref:hypothetical protein n=1 Tax=Nonomuraea dietziae TaxID=65515 RepID=UPI0031DC3690